MELRGGCAASSLLSARCARSESNLRRFFEALVGSNGRISITLET
jgi:hypothetical protein